MEGLIPDDIIHAYLETPEGLRSAGRMLLYNGTLSVLENYFGILNHIPTGPVTDETLLHLNNFSSPLFLTTQGSILAGENLDLIPEMDLTEEISHPEVDPAKAEDVPQKTVYHYLRTGMNVPVTIESNSNGDCFYDGNKLEQAEIDHILNNIRAGLATIKHVKSIPLEKAWDTFMNLAKNNPRVWLANMEKLYAQNPHPDLLEAINGFRHTTYVDPKTSESKLGNQFAWDEFREKKLPGAYIGMDLNNFKQQNDTFGHDTGDNSIKAFARAARNAADKIGDMKLFRSGGDEFTAHAPTPEHAHRFVRELRNQLEPIPHIGGTHKLSASVGIGHTPEVADQALLRAKEGKKGHTVSSIPSVLAHSLHPSGPSGILPTSDQGIVKTKKPRTPKLPKPTSTSG